jgi:hypothetical protein
MSGIDHRYNVGERKSKGIEFSFLDLVQFMIIANNRLLTLKSSNYINNAFGLDSSGTTREPPINSSSRGISQHLLPALSILRVGSAVA